MTNTWRILLALATITYVAGNSGVQAAVVINTSVNVAPAGNVHDPYDPATDTSASGPMLTPSSVDIVQGFTEAGGGISTTGNDNQEQSAGVNVTTDGSIATVYNEGGPGGDAIDHAAFASVNTNDLITYTLGGLYDLTRVDIFSGWGDSGRDDFSFNFLISNDGVQYIQIASYDKGADNTGTFTTPVFSLHSITNDSSANIATSVQSIQIQVVDADNGFAGLAEVDVFGTPLNIPGDANHDNVVDINDFFVISNNFLNAPSASGEDGDINFDNIVDQRDFRMWRQITGADLQALGIDASSIPEPTSVVLLGICTLAGLTAAGRRA